ncbi:MAG: hypothetical protein ABMB14_12395 [Myxococcota bacterium]
MTILLAALTAALACPPDVAAAASTLETAKAVRHAAYDKVHETDWDALAATGDRDRVLADQAAATDALREARQGVRDARKVNRDLKDAYPAEELACAPDDLPPRT